VWPIDGDGVESVLQPDSVMADSPAIGNDQAVGLQRLSLPILPGGTALPYSGVGDTVRGTPSAPHSVAPP